MGPYRVGNDLLGLTDPGYNWQEMGLIICNLVNVIEAFVLVVLTSQCWSSNHIYEIFYWYIISYNSNIDFRKCP